MLLDPLGNALNKINRYDNMGKKEVMLQPTSNIIQDVLATLQKEQYIGEFEKIENGRGGQFKVQLLGRINKMGVIKPRFPVKASEIANWEKRYLPAINFGFLILSTSIGVITQRVATERRLGGRLIAYVF